MHPSHPKSDANHVKDFPVDEYAVLLGHKPIQEFLQFVKVHAVNGRSLRDHELAQEWAAASVRVQELGRTEDQLAEHGPAKELPESLRQRGKDLLGDPIVQESVGLLPTRWGLVELDRLCLKQKYVNRTYCRAISARLPQEPNTDQLLTVASRWMDDASPIAITAANGNTITFTSASNDLQVLGVTPIDPTAIKTEPPSGRVRAVLGIFVGYGLNCIWALQFGRRLLLCNGTHRAVALRAAGATHAPCLITRVEREDDLDLLLGATEAKASALYTLKAQRPALLRDFFDDSLIKVISGHRFQHTLQLSLTFLQNKVPGLQ